MRWLSDRFRPVVVAASALACALLMAWWVRGTDEGEIGAVAVLAQPVGTEVVLSLLRVLSIDGPDRYVVGHAALRVPVRGPTDERAVGEEITIGGVVERGHVRAVWVEDAPNRPLKYALGIAGLLAGAALLAASTRVTRTGLALRG